LASMGLSIDEQKAVERFRTAVVEPSTPTLARSCSTPELRPLWRHVTGRRKAALTVG